MENVIRAFAKQFLFEPRIERAERLNAYDPTNGSSAIVGGMGGSHLAADILAVAKPGLALRVHSSYGLPGGGVSGDFLYIASSYSGNTEESLDFAREARRHDLPLAGYSVGGALAEFIRKESLPFIELPNVGIQPRSALGYSIAALAAFIGDDSLRKEIRSLADSLHPDDWQMQGESLAAAIRGTVPVIYASEENRPVAYNWKIKFNETGKVPAFMNTFPELNHNELAGMDVIAGTKELSERLHFIFIEDEADHERIRTRMEVTRRLYGERGLRTSQVSMTGGSRLERMFNSLLLADWAAVKTARAYGAEPEQVAIIETFKKLIG